MNIQSSITETHETWTRGNLVPFWSKQSITALNYTYSPSEDNMNIKWKRQGYMPDTKHLSGDLCDFKQKQPAYNETLIKWFEDTFSVTDTGTAYFQMKTDTILPVHSDHFSAYRKLFGCNIKDCVRVILFPFKWESGHYFEIDGNPIVNWDAGDFICWSGSTPHLAANMGLKTRYSIQLTGHGKKTNNR